LTHSDKFYNSLLVLYYLRNLSVITNFLARPVRRYHDDVL